MLFLVATNVVASWPPERRPTGTPHARAKTPFNKPLSNFDPPPPPFYPLLYNFIYLDLCECINPWDGKTFFEHIGDKDNTCPNFCYVSCNSDCNDIKQARGEGRCFSKVACDSNVVVKKKGELKVEG